jgi:LysM repeat protein
MVPGSDYIDKPLRTTTGYTPPGQGATPATTRGYPNPVTDPEGYKKAINQGLLKKYAGDAQPAAASATPTPAAASSVTVKPGDTLSKIAAANGTTVQAIMAANPSIKDANKIAAGQTVKLRESSEVARIRHLAGLTRN